MTCKVVTFVCFWQVSVYASEDKIEQTQLALDVLKYTIEKYEQYFGIKYPLPKQGKGLVTIITHQDTALTSYWVDRKVGVAVSDALIGQFHITRENHIWWDVYVVLETKAGLSLKKNGYAILCNFYHFETWKVSFFCRFKQIIIFKSWNAFRLLRWMFLLESVWVWSTTIWEFYNVLVPNFWVLLKH